MRSFASPLRIIWLPIILAAGALAAPALSRGVAAAAVTERNVTIQDGCDSESFNAVFGPGTCVRNGGVNFDEFIALLMKHQSAGAWHFGPPQTSAKVGDTFVAVNRGGEVHTFTEVEDFGGGIIPELNALSGTPIMAPECGRLEDDDFVPPGTTYRETADEAGVVKFQCCIHPWMRLTATVK
jgi:plastocyanin